jgi:hypothetical protein
LRTIKSTQSGISVYALCSSNSIPLAIAPALTVAIQTARWAAKVSRDAQISGVDAELDREVGYAVRGGIRVLHELLWKHKSLFPQRNVSILKPVQKTIALRDHGPSSRPGCILDDMR